MKIKDKGNRAEKEDKTRTVLKENPTMGDMFDVIREILKVNTVDTPLNVDVSLSALKTENTQQKFVRSRIGTSLYAMNYIQEEDSKKEIGKILLSDVNSMIILSRSGEGAVRDAILTAIATSGQTTEVSTGTGAKQEMMEQKKGILGTIRGFLPGG